MNSPLNISKHSVRTYHSDIEFYTRDPKAYAWAIEDHCRVLAKAIMNGLNSGPVVISGNVSFVPRPEELGHSIKLETTIYAEPFEAWAKDQLDSGQAADMRCVRVPATNQLRMISHPPKNDNEQPA